jgi:hypothetical protein
VVTVLADQERQRRAAARSADLVALVSILESGGELAASQQYAAVTRGLELEQLMPYLSALLARGRPYRAKIVEDGLMHVCGYCGQAGPCVTVCEWLQLVAATAVYAGIAVMEPRHFDDAGDA